MDMMSPRENTEETRHRRQAGAALRRWAEQGRPAGVVRVLERHGFGTVATGQLLAGTADGDRAGAVFEGTMDAVALPLLTAAVSTPAPQKGTSPSRTRWPLGWPAAVAPNCWVTHYPSGPPPCWVPRSSPVNRVRWPPQSMGRPCSWRLGLG